MKKSKLLKILSVIFILIFALSIPFSALAQGLSDVPYKNYTYWDCNGSKKAVETKAVFEPLGTITGEDLGIGEFSELQHMFSYNGKLYVLDSANGRIIILDKNYKVLKQIKGSSYKNESISFEGAKGLFVDESGVYIADTSNKRVLCLDGNYNVKRIVTKPDDTSIPATFDFAPIKLARDSYGYFYLLCEGSYYGMMVFDDNFVFSGFFGANNVNANFSDAIKEFIVSIFETEEKHSNSVQALPFSLLDICLDKEGFLVTVNSETKGQIRRFGLSGKNILKKNMDFVVSATDSFNFADNPVMYVDKTSKYNNFLTCAFCAITCDDDGFYYAIEETQGRIYMYDTDCNLLAVFGGGIRQGNQTGTFQSPDALCVFGSDLLVSDFSTGKITRFSVTDYGKTLKTGDKYFVENNYIKAKDYFEKIYKQDKNCQIAVKGLARAYLKEGDYEKSMELSRLAFDKKTYSKAFEKVRTEYIKKNFIWMFALAIILVGFVCFMFFKKTKTNIKIKNPQIKTALSFVFHPIDSLNAVKYKGLGSVAVSTVLLVLFYVSQICSSLYGGFAFSNVDLSTFNALLTLIGTVGIVVLWSVAGWLVCILFDGKGRFKEIYCSTCLCLIPLIIYNVIYAVFSNLIVPTSNSVFELIGTICYIITGLFLILSVMVIHDFTFFKSLGISLVVILGMAIVAFVAFIMLTLWQDLISFISQIVNEATMR